MKKLEFETGRMPIDFRTREPNEPIYSFDDMARDIYNFIGEARDRVNEYEKFDGHAFDCVSILLYRLEREYPYLHLFEISDPCPTD